jgi:Sulfotransferase domain
MATTMPSPSQPGLLPNLVIIGAMKSGTSSLHQYLNLHHQVRMSSNKELDFFVEGKNWQRGTEWYRSNFTEAADVVGESSSNYSKCSVFPGVPERMHSLIPHAKLIYMVRDPVRRILSHYNHQFTNRDERATLDMALADLTHNHYVDCSCYGMQLEKFLPYYSLSNILVVSLEDLASDRLATLKRVFQFLGIDPTFEHPDFSTVFHQSSQKKRLSDFGARMFRLPAGGRLLKVLPQLMTEDVPPPVMSDALRQALSDILRSDVERLRSLTGETFSAWKL